MHLLLLLFVILSYAHPNFARKITLRSFFVFSYIFYVLHQLFFCF